MKGKPEETGPAAARAATAAGAAGRERGGARPWLLAGLVAGLAALAFSPALSAGFVDWDDPSNILDNPSFRGFTAEHWRWFWNTTHLGVYEPLGWILKAAVHAVSGLSPLGFHAASLLIHAINAALLFLVARRLLGRVQPAASAPARDLAAALAALLFALHPLRAEVAVWASAQSYGLAGTFCLAALIAYLDAFPAPPARPSRRRLLLAFVFYAASLLSKTAAISLPLALLVLDVYPLRRLDPSAAGAGRRALRLVAEKVPFVLLAAVIASLTIGIPSTSGIPGGNAIAPLDRLLIAGRAVWFYAARTLVPAGLSPFYPLPIPATPLPLRFLWASLVAILITALALAVRRTVPAFTAAWCAYLAFLAPVSGVVRHGDQVGADRYSYLSCLGFAIAAAGAVLALWRSRPGGRTLLAGGAALVLLLLAGASVRQARVWHDTRTLWTHAVAVDPDNWLALNNLANDGIDHGGLERGAALAESIAARWPEWTEARATLGRARFKQGRLEEARGLLREVLRADPYNAAVLEYGEVLRGLGRTGEAITVYRRRLLLTPEETPVINNLAVFLLAESRAGEARALLERALASQREDAQLHYNLAMAEAQLENWQRARGELRATLAIDPAYPRAAERLAALERGERPRR